MAKNSLRLYRSINDFKMLAEAQTMLDLFTTDLAKFEAMDAELNAGFAAEVQQAIDVAIKTPTDAIVLYEISELTDNMKDAWQACKDHFMDAKYFIKKAFKNNKARQNSFGFNDYRAMCRHQKRVDMFMQLYDLACREHAAALISAGYSQVRIDEIELLNNAFLVAQRKLHNAKLLRAEKTYDRIKIYNNVWKYLQRINSASKSVFRNNYAKLQQYLLPQPAGK